MTTQNTPEPIKAYYTIYSISKSKQKQEPFV